MGNSNLYAAANDTKTLLNENWSLSPQPDITFVWEEKATGFMDDRRDFILISPENEDPQYFGLYGQDFLHQISVRIEIHSFQNLEHHENLVNEIFRIVKENIRRTDFIDLSDSRSASVTNSPGAFSQDESPIASTAGVTELNLPIKASDAKSEAIKAPFKYSAIKCGMEWSLFSDIPNLELMLQSIIVILKVI